MMRSTQLVGATHVGLSRQDMHERGTALTHPRPGVEVMRVTFVVLTRLLWTAPRFRIPPCAGRSLSA